MLAPTSGPVTVLFLPVSMVQPNDEPTFERCRLGCGCSLDVCGAFHAGIHFEEQRLVCACCVAALAPDAD